MYNKFHLFISGAVEHVGWNKSKVSYYINAYASPQEHLIYIL